MNHDQHMPDQQERQMLEHFRQHSSGEPSAQLDAQILAAASAAVRSAAINEAQPSLRARLHHWLFGTGGRQRWSVALAGVACLGIGVSLTWRTFEQAPDAFDAVPSAAPMAPAAARIAPAATLQAESTLMADEAQQPRAAQGYSDAAGKAEKKLSEGVARQRLAEQPATSKPAETAASRADKQLHGELQQLLKLRRDGWTEEADALFLRLMREYPELDIEAQLQQLQQPD